MSGSVLYVAIAGAVGASVLMSVRARSAKKLAVQALPILAQRGPMNLQAIAAALGVTGRTPINHLSIALNDLRARGELVASDPPPGTPLFDRKNAMVYALPRLPPS